MSDGGDQSGGSPLQASLQGSLEGKVALVTGASRGAGKGIALALGRAGMTVYLTGRTQQEGDAALPGHLQATADAVDAAGGRGIAVVCDHSDDSQVRALIERIGQEQARLDLLVNNVTCVPDGMTEPGPFWNKPLSLLDICDVGMRSHYVCTYFAAELLCQSGGAVVMTSSFGGRIYMHGPAYGAGKAAVDKMAHDMAVDFKPFQVPVISLWMGFLLTERSLAVIEAEPEKYGALVDTAETPEYPGRVIAAFVADASRMDKTGQVWIGAELGEHYGIVDSNDRQPPSHRAMFGPPTEFGEAVVE